MTNTATLIQSNLAQFCPITNLYACSDGQHLLVTVKYPPTLCEVLGIDEPMTTAVPQGVDVFLSDENGVVLDADGDPANGMTQLWTSADNMTHAQALAELGYTLEHTPQETT